VRNIENIRRYEIGLKRTFLEKSVRNMNRQIEMPIPGAAGVPKEAKCWQAEHATYMTPNVRLGPIICITKVCGGILIKSQT